MTSYVSQATASGRNFDAMTFAELITKARTLAQRNEDYDVMDTLTDDPPLPSKWPDTVWWKRSIYIDQAYAQLCIEETRINRICNG